MGRGVEPEASGACLLENGNYGAACVVWGVCEAGAGWSVGRQLRVGAWSMSCVNWKGMDKGAFVPKAPGTAWAEEEEETLCQFAPTAITNYCGILKQHRFMISP